MNRKSRALLGLALLLAVVAANAEPIRYNFTSGAAINIDPLLAGLTSVSGDFIYENDTPLVVTDASTGNSVYLAWSQLSGTVNGNSFSSLRGAAIVGNDSFTSVNLANSDFCTLVSTTNGQLNGFTFNGLDLTGVRMFWIEGQNGIPDFLNNQDLPSILPPTIAGTLALDFTAQGTGTVHRAFYFVELEPAGTAITKPVGWTGSLTYVDIDAGGGIYAGSSLGSEFTIEIDLTTTLGRISDGATLTRFSADSSSGNTIQFTDNMVVTVEDADWINAVAGTNFSSGDVVDIVELSGDAETESGGRIDIGVIDVLDAAAFSGVGPTTYPPDSRDLLTRFFFIEELDGMDVGIYSAGGTISDVNPPGTFDDVPVDYWAFSFIEKLLVSGITSGCGGGNYCPENIVTRAQMAVFLERGIRGSDYSPPAATGNVFLDVAASDFAASFIEQLFADGITGGCGNNNYCPDAGVTRAQMAVFLLRSKFGSAYVPPPANGIFDDVPIGSFADAWVEQLAAEGITSGCGGGNYCPDDPVTRAQMAVFLVRAFGL
jgi:hypothetical protein